MDMGTSSSMAMTTSTMSMSMSSSTSSSTSSMDMDMSMNMYLNENYKSYPVIFKTLKAESPAAVFGIFCFLFFTAFFLRSIMFLSAYLEQKIWKSPALINNCNNDEVVTASAFKATGDQCCGGDADGADDMIKSKSTDEESQNYEMVLPAPATKSVLSQLFYTTWIDLQRDIVRLLIAFVIAMIGYALMLAAMTFIITYFFAICLGFAFADVFFNRLSMILKINPHNTLCSSLH